VKPAVVVPCGVLSIMVATTNWLRMRRNRVQCRTLVTNP